MASGSLWSEILGEEYPSPWTKNIGMWMGHYHRSSTYSDQCAVQKLRTVVPY